jgi:hypothetical protein
MIQIAVKNMKSNIGNWKVRLFNKLEKLSDRWFDKAMEGSGKLVDKTIEKFGSKTPKNDNH